MNARPNAADLRILSRLLDQALELEWPRLEHWLAGLPAAIRHLVPPLRKLLRAHHASGCADFLTDGPRLDAASPDRLAQAGDMAGPYRLLKEVGRGGMCSVWLAERAGTAPGRRFALKMPRRPVDQNLALRLANERDISALMDHPNVCHLRDAGSDAAGRPYLVLDYVSGPTLDTWCGSRQCSVAGRLRLFLQVARAVAYVHGLGVVHRDLKPANVLVDQDRQVHLIDFGIARRLHSPRPVGSPRAVEHSMTPGYASPEQRRGEATCCRSDVYSLGVLLFELLTGRLPHARRPGLLPEDAWAPDAAAPRASRFAKDASSARALRGPIDAMLRKALAPRPEQRHASASALADDAARCLDGVAAGGAPPQEKTVC
jgi:serine/threonine-protein kinase